VALLRRLRKAAALEHAEEVLRAEIERCGQEQPAAPEES
jgi:hypothetical protein